MLGESLQYLVQYLAFVFAMIFSGCAVKNADSLDFKANLPQNASFYVLDSNDSTSKIAKNKESKELKKRYLKRHFSVWEDRFHAPKKSDMFWAIYDKSGFDESKKPINKQFFNTLIKSMNMDSYPTMQKKAIMIKTTNVRVLPTNKPRFNKIDGYPFDRWQNSLIFAYTPIVVLHSDKNKEWFLVQSSFVAGWVKADEVAFMSEKQVSEMKNGEFVIPIKDKIPLYYNGLFLLNTRVGMPLLVDKESKIIAYTRDMDGNAVKLRVDFNRTHFAPFPLPFSEANIASMIEAIGFENYGWGGAYQNRDCSSFIRDIFASVGVWLPRNSKAQVEWGKRVKDSSYVELPQNNDEKIALIKEIAKPFRTIIWLKGHIMLYVGEIGGNIIVAHQVWGIGSGDRTEILSSVSITTLTPQIDFENGIIVQRDLDSNQSLLDKIRAINVVW